MNKEFCTRMRSLRKENGWSQAKLAEKMNIHQTAISHWESGRSEPDSNALSLLARLFDVTVDYLLGHDGPAERQLPPGTLPLPSMHDVPLLGEIACGEPILCAANFNGTVKLPDGIHADFCLVAKGDSMIGARIFPGDIVYFVEQPTVEEGEIAAVLIGGEDTTLKRFHRYPDHIELVAENPMYPPIRIYDDGTTDVRILGKAVCYFSVTL